MKRKRISWIIPLLLLLLFTSSRDASASRTTAAVAPPDLPLVQLLPERTLIAVEVRDLSSRWDEIQRLPAIPRLIDQLLEGTGLGAEDVRRLAGDRAVLALVRSLDGRSALPVAVLKPARMDEAERHLSGVGDPERLLEVQRARGALWVAGRDSAGDLRALAAGDGTCLMARIPTAQARLKLPAGGLVRGWIHAAEIARLLRARVPGTLPAPVEIVGSLVAAELEAIRSAAFRRDLTPDGVVADAVISYDLDTLPREVAAVFERTHETAVLPSPLPRGVVMAAAFPPEGDALLPWLRYAAGRDPRGPLRNLEFWIEEFEERSGHDLERDLMQELGEQAWLFVTEGNGADPGAIVLILETADAARVEQTLLSLRSSLSEHVFGRTLGLAVPRADDVATRGVAIHGIGLWTPLGQAEGPAFAVSQGHVVLATGKDAVRDGLAILETRDRWRPPPVVDVPPGAQGAILVRGTSLARLIEALTPGCEGEAGALEAAAETLLGDLDRVAAGMWYAEDSVRLRARVRFRTE